jgi:hypothetical protein
LAADAGAGADVLAAAGLAAVGLAAGAADEQAVAMSASVAIGVNQPRRERMALMTSSPPQKWLARRERAAGWY